MNIYPISGCYVERNHEARIIRRFSNSAEVVRTCHEPDESISSRSSQFKYANPRPSRRNPLRTHRSRRICVYNHQRTSLQLLYIAEIPICDQIWHNGAACPNFHFARTSNANFHPLALNRTPNRALESCATLALLCIAAKRLAATRNVTTTLFSFAFNPFRSLSVHFSLSLSHNPSVLPGIGFSPLSAVVSLINKIVYSINEIRSDVAMDVLS